jgi:outer membrane receptor protein involved in Fe transport
MRLTAALLFAFSLAAHADSIADEADFRFHRAASLYREGKVEEALGEFLASNRLVRNRNVIFNIARSFEELKHFNEAYRWYVEILTDEMPEADRKDLLAGLRRLQPALALLRVQTDPPGATVFVDRKDLGARGQTPVTLALPPGKAQVMVELAGYRPFRQEAQLAVGKTVELSPALDRIYGAIAVSGEPQGAEVRVDAGSENQGPPLLLQDGRANVVPGRHILTFSAPGHMAQQIAVEIPADGVAPVTFALPLLPPPTGKLVVRANVEKALVRVDGKEAGFTPGVIDVTAGKPHTIEIVAEGRETVVQKIEVQKDEQSPMDAKLRWALPRVVAAEKELTRAQDAPASITVISGEEIRAFGYATLAEALRSVRGLYFSSDRDYESIGVRGFSTPGTYNNRMLVLSDGHVTNESSVGQGYVGREFDADLSDVERIEIVRGPGSVLYGSAAFFAVVNVVHKAPRPGTHGDVDARIGTLGENSGSVSGSLASEWSYLWARASGGDVTGDRFFVPPGGGGVAPDLDKERAAHLDLRARAGGFSLLASYNYRKKAIPTGAFDTSLGTAGTDTTDHRGFVEANFSHTLASGLGVDARASYDGARYRGNWQYNQIGPGYDTSVEDWLDGELRVRLPEFAGNRVFAGGEFVDKLRVNLTNFVPQAPYFSNVPGEKTGAIPNTEKIVSGYLGDDFRISPRLQIDAALRVDDYLDSSFGTVFNPRIAILAQPYTDGHTKLIFGQAFRAPGIYERFYNDAGFTQIAAANLRPERVTTAEIEHAHQWSDEVSLLVAGYFSRMQDLIRVVSVDPGPSAQCSPDCLQYQNRSGYVHSAGAELEVRWQAGPGTLFSAWYAFSFVRDDSGAALFAGRPVANSPAHTGAVRMMLPIVSQALLVSTEAIYGSPRHTVADQAEPDRQLGDSLLWNIGLSGEYRNLRYGAFVQNILDRRFTLPAGPEIPFPGHAVPQYGRMLRLQLSASF